VIPEDTQALISWKTDAWKNPDFVSLYNARMNDPSGGIPIKNRVETALCARLAAGTDLLDVGIGTGRASLPLARAGKALTGVDSSQAMLDATRANAGDTPIRLVQGDVAKLPFTGERFDTIMALNTIAHFPHWDAILAEWQRFVRPGGRLVFDIFSLDHHHAVGAARGMSPAAAAAAYGPTGHHDYFTRVTADELARTCDRLGLRIVEVAPYGALFGLASSNDWLRDSAAFDRSWDRLCSWSGDFPPLFDLFVTLEEALLAQLGTQASGRMMVALDNAPDPAANAAWQRRNYEKNEALRLGLTPAALAACGIDVPALAAKVRAALAFRPNRVAVFRLLTAALNHRYPVPLNAWLDAGAADAVTDMLLREQLDRDIRTAIEQAAALAGEVLHYGGVDLGDAYKYELTEAILDAGLGVFDERRVTP
jgi:2-polyprenyl-3-methyl-5-hydroxy-6-metoxy-1,4-benzoquinol methylase